MPGKVRVPLTPERIEACRRLFAARGVPLPPDAKITGIEIQVEDWICNSCSSEVRGVTASYPKEAAKCDNCGSPMEPDSGERYRPSTRADNVTMTPEQIDAALTGGPNWTCQYCGAGGNRAKINGMINTRCDTCGAERADYTNYLGKNTEQYQPTAVRPTQARRVLIKNKKRAILIGGGIVAALGIVIFLYITLQDTPTEGEVIYARWIHTVRVEQWQPVIERGKKEDIKESAMVPPVNGEGGTPGAMIIECSGSSCLYETYQWVPVASKEKRGTWDEEMPSGQAWAQFDTPANGRITSITRYDVDLTFSHNGEKHTTEWRPSTYEEFRHFKPGSKIVVELDPLRNISNLHVEKGEK